MVWKDTRLLLLSLALDSYHDGHFSINHRSFQRACVPVGCVTLPFSATGGIAMSWLAVETSDVPYVLRRALGDLTGRQLSPGEGWVRATEQKPRGEGAAELLPQRSITLRRVTRKVSTAKTLFSCGRACLACCCTTHCSGGFWVGTKVQILPSFQLKVRSRTAQSLLHCQCHVMTVTM